MTQELICEYSIYNSLGHDRSLKFYACDEDRGIIFSHKGMKYKPTLNNTKGSLFLGGSIKTFTGESERESWKKPKIFSVTEHLLATLYATGHHNVEVQFEGPNIPIFGIMPPQSSNRELGLVKLLMQHGSPNPFNDSFQLPSFSREDTHFLFKTSGGDEDSLRISSRVDLNGFECREERIFTNDYSSPQDYLEIAGSRPYSPFHRVLSSYIGSQTQEEVEEIARHSVLDRLGAVALLANTLNRRITGNLDTWRSGHKSDIELFKEIEQGEKK